MDVHVATELSESNGEGLVLREERGSATLPEATSNGQRTHLNPEVLLELNHLRPLSKDARRQREEGGDIGVQSVKLVDELEVVGLGKVVPLAEPAVCVSSTLRSTPGPKLDSPLRRSPPITMLVFLYRLPQRPALPSKLFLPFRLCSQHEQVYGMRLWWYFWLLVGVDGRAAFFGDDSVHRSCGGHMTRVEEVSSRLLVQNVGGELQSKGDHDARARSPSRSVANLADDCRYRYSA